MALASTLTLVRGAKAALLGAETSVFDTAEGAEDAELGAADP